MTLPPLSFSRFESDPPAAYAGDPIWNTRVFRMAAYLSSRCAGDVSKLGAGVTFHVAQQFVRAVSSVEANIAEGYSRSGSADQARFYAYALGSVREALAWIDSLGETPWPARAEYVDLLVQMRRQLLTALRRMRVLHTAQSKGRLPGRPITYRKRES